MDITIEVRASDLPNQLRPTPAEAAANAMNGPRYHS